MSKAATDPDWAPKTVNMATASALATTILQQVRSAGFTREEFAVAVAITAEAATGLADGEELDPEVCRFLAERFLAVSIAHSGGSQ